MFLGKINFLCIVSINTPELVKIACLSKYEPVKNHSPGFPLPIFYELTTAHRLAVNKLQASNERSDTLR